MSKVSILAWASLTGSNRPKLVSNSVWKKSQSVAIVDPCRAGLNSVGSNQPGAGPIRKDRACDFSSATGEGVSMVLKMKTALKDENSEFVGI